MRNRWNHFGRVFIVNFEYVSEACLVGDFQVSMMKLFAKIVHGF